MTLMSAAKASITHPARQPPPAGRPPQDRQQGQANRQRAPSSQPARLEGQRTLEDVVEPRRADVEIVAVTVAPGHVPLRQAHRSGRGQQQAVERAQALDLPPGRPRRRPQRGARVAAVVVIGLVVARPQRLVGGHGHEQPAAGPCHPPELNQSGDVVGDVLDHVEAGDEVKRGVVPGKFLEPPDPHLAQAAPAGQLGRVGVELDATHLAAVVHELHQGAPRAAPGVEHVRPHRQRQAIQLGADDAPAAPVPPVVLVDGERRFHHRLVHERAGWWQIQATATGSFSGACAPGSRRVNVAPRPSPSSR